MKQDTCEPPKHLKKGPQPPARIQKQEFISYFVSQLKAKANKQLKDEAA